MSHQPNGEDANLSTVFKSHPRPDVVKDLLHTYRSKAKTHLQETIPNKLVAIQALLATENDPNSMFWSGHVSTPSYTSPTILQPDDPSLAELGIKPRVLPDQVIRAKTSRSNSSPRDDELGAHWLEVVPENKIQSEAINLLITELEDLHMIVQDLRVWLDLEVPVVEDGNSFGAEVQQLLIRELIEAYKKSNAYQNGARNHYADRLKLAAEWVKYPNLMDFPTAIAASDRFDHLILRSYLRSLLQVYGSLMIKFERNWEKVINPKGSTSRAGMY